MCAGNFREYREIFLLANITVLVQVFTFYQVFTKWKSDIYFSEIWEHFGSSLGKRLHNSTEHDKR